MDRGTIGPVPKTLRRLLQPKNNKKLNVWSLLNLVKHTHIHTTPLLSPLDLLLEPDSLSGYQLDIHHQFSVPPRISLRSWRAVPQSASAVKGPVLPQRIALQLSSPPPTDYQFNSQPDLLCCCCGYYYYYLACPKRQL